jgi:hypothetical protein
MTTFRENLFRFIILFRLFRYYNMRFCAIKVAFPVNFRLNLKPIQSISKTCIYKWGSLNASYSHAVSLSLWSPDGSAVA